MKKVVSLELANDMGQALQALWDGNPVPYVDLIDGPLTTTEIAARAIDTVRSVRIH